MVTVADGMYSPDHAAARDSVVGDLLCLLSAVVYGAYTVSLRWGCVCWGGRLQLGMSWSG